jgi:multidrug efflux pump subunit AcrA (membrane-fusion protein)
MKRYSLLIMILIGALLLQGCGILGGGQPQSSADQTVPTVMADTEVVSEGNLAPRDYAYLTFAVGGELGEILVAKGDQVGAGQVLARLGDRQQAEAGLASAALALLSAQQDYDTLLRTADLARASAWLDWIDARAALIAAGRAWGAVDTDDFQQKVDDARTAVQDAQTNLEDAQEEFDKYVNFDTDNPTRQRAEDDLTSAQNTYDEAVRKQDELLNQYDRAQAGLLQAEAALAEAKRTYDNLQDGPDPDQLALAQARLDNAQAQHAAALAALDKTELQAPFAGTVVDINAAVSELVGPDTWVILLADFSQWYIETTDLTELEVVKISLGQSVTVVPDALPDLELNGEVTEISDVFTAQGGDILYKVRILLPEIDPLLRWGMTMEVRFYP